jgi:DnaJ domain
MPRRVKSDGSFGRKPTYWEKLKAGTSHPTYDPQVEGYGNPAEWASTFNVRMGFKDAQEYAAHGTRRKWTSNWRVLSEIAGVDITENSMWGEIKSAFRKAAMNCHPDRAAATGRSVEELTEEFKDALAAYKMLEDVYTMQGRLK